MTKLKPPITDPRDKTCARCRGYTFRRRPHGCWAFCRTKQKWFEYDVDFKRRKTSKLPGARTCDDWKQQ